MPKGLHKPFNTAFETGVRAVAHLEAAYPDRLDLQRLTAMDYLILRTSVLGGPKDLHPPSPITAPATQVRRQIVQSALDMMMSRDLIERHIGKTGFGYRAGETSNLFLSSLTTGYMLELKVRAQWLANHLRPMTDVDLDTTMRSLFDQWLVEFKEPSLNGGSLS